MQFKKYEDCIIKYRYKIMYLFSDFFKEVIGGRENLIFVTDGV